MKRRSAILFISILLAISGCSTTKRTVPYVELAKDYLGSGLPKYERRFVDVAKPVDASVGRIVYLRVSTPPGIKVESRNKHIESVEGSLRKIGVERIVTHDEMQHLLQDGGVKFSFDREPDPSEFLVAENKLGKFLVVDVNYDFWYGSSRYVRIKAQSSSDFSVLFDGYYDSIIWSDVYKELFFPAMNIYANWIHGTLELKAAK